MKDVTRILGELQRGGAAPAAELLPVVYEELRKLAVQRLAHERAGMTLQPTALVHEAFLRLVDVDRLPQQWNGRGHFFAAAAEAMRRILVENARHRKSLKGGGQWQRVDLDDVDVVASENGSALDMLALDEALAKLQGHDQRKAEVVKLRFFAGLTNDQAADALGISSATAENDWAYARAWLRLQIQGEASKPAMVNRDNKLMLPSGAPPSDYAR